MKGKKDSIIDEHEQFRLLTENSSDTLWTMSLDGVLQYVSPAFTELTGYARDEAVGAHFSKFIVPEYLPYIHEVLSGELAKPRQEQAAVKMLELQEVAKDGSVIDVELTAKWIYDGKGNPVGIQGSTRDIRKRKQALQALEESEERYRALVERSLDIIYIHDFNGNFIDANGAALKTLGYQKEDIKHLNLVSMLTESQVPRAFKLIREIREKGVQDELTEFEVQTKDGRRVILETRAFLIYRNRKPFAVQGVGREITERKKAIEEQRWNQEKLEMVVQ